MKMLQIIDHGIRFLKVSIIFLSLPLIQACVSIPRHQDLSTLFTKRRSKEYNIKVKSYDDPEIHLSGYKTFTFDYMNKENPLLEKELCRMLQSQLEQKGLKRVNNDAQLLITMSFFTGKKEQYTPPKTITTTTYQSVWNSGFVGWTPVGYAETVPVVESQTQPGYTTISFYRNIRLNFLDTKELKNGKKTDLPPVVWIAEAESEGSSNDIRDVAPYLIGEMLAEFPVKSGHPAQRQVYSSTYATIGLALDGNDWRQILKVEQASPADRAGVKAGDMLVAINGKRMAKNMSYYTDDIGWKTEKNYTSQDPYYRMIFNNKENTEVEITVKSPSSDESRKVKVIPVVSEHCRRLAGGAWTTIK